MFEQLYRYNFHPSHEGIKKIKKIKFIFKNRKMSKDKETKTWRKLYLKLVRDNFQFINTIYVSPILKKSPFLTDCTRKGTS